MRPLWCVVFTLCMGLSTLSAQDSPCPALPALRTAFLGHGSLDQAMASKALAESKLDGTEGACRATIEAHRWVSWARSADFEWNPATKLSRLNTGLDSLDALVALHPKLDILKALRLTITGTAPRFLGVNSDWPVDRAATQRLLDADHWAESPKFSVWMADLMEQTD